MAPISFGKEDLWNYSYPKNYWDRSTILIDFLPLKRSSVTRHIPELMRTIQSLNSKRFRGRSLTRLTKICPLLPLLGEIRGFFTMSKTDRHLLHQRISAMKTNTLYLCFLRIGIFYLRFVLTKTRVFIFITEIL